MSMSNDLGSTFAIYLKHLSVSWQTLNTHKCKLPPRGEIWGKLPRESGVLSMKHKIPTMPLSPACVAEVTSDTPLEEALAALACEDTIVFTTGLVATHHAVHHAGLVVLSGLHVASSRLGRAVLLIPPQVAFVPQPVGAPIGISPAPAHHCHRLVTEPPKKKMGQAAKISGCCQGNINIKSPDCVFPLT